MSKDDFLRNKPPNQLWHKMSLNFPSNIDKVHVSVRPLMGSSNNSSVPQHQVNLYVSCNDSNVKSTHPADCRYQLVTPQPSVLTRSQGLNLPISLHVSHGPGATAQIQNEVQSPDVFTVPNNSYRQHEILPFVGADWLSNLLNPEKMMQYQAKGPLLAGDCVPNTPFLFPQSASSCPDSPLGSIQSFVTDSSDVGRLPPRRVMGCKICPICLMMKCRQYKKLIEHVQMHHGIPLCIEEMDFENMLLFVSWKHKIEKDTSSNFVQKCGISEVKHSMNSYFICNRSGRPQIRQNANDLSRSQASSSITVQATCTAFIRAALCKTTGRIKVYYCSTHLGH